MPTKTTKIINDPKINGKKLVSPFKNLTNVTFPISIVMAIVSKFIAEYIAIIDTIIVAKIKKINNPLYLLILSPIPDKIALIYINMN